MKSYKKDYPRPQMVRSAWLNLNGAWGFAFDDKKEGRKKGYPFGFPREKTIQVPFTYETALSGIHDETRHDCIWYEKKVSLTPKQGQRLLLHFEGSDYKTSVWLNGKYLGFHEGAYERFSFDITDAALSGDNTLVVQCEDSFSTAQPRGKQRWIDENFGCWYVQTTGIWKTVWIESVPKTYITRLKLTPDMTAGEIIITADIEGEVSEGTRFKADVSFEGRAISSLTAEVKSSRITIRANTTDPLCAFGAIHRWMPEEPGLYDLALSLEPSAGASDTVLSYFGMRDVRIENGNILLNGKPIYQKLILDQGYWPDSGITPPNEEALIEDIDKIHQLGFNGLRKHMKIEDERFLYWCDVKGMLVWSEMAAAYQYNDNAVEAYTKEWIDIVRQNYSHPCIITWTPFNESWGVPAIKTDKRQQDFTQAIYYLTKSIDPMRPVITNDGWEHTISDILTLHDYEEDGAVFLERYLDHKDDITSTRIYHSRDKSAMADGFEYRGQPVIISEYGGIAFSKKSDGQWGYGHGVKDEEEFLARFKKITDAIKALPYVTGYCYTQVTDVQQEVNGLMTMDRQFKVPPEKIAEINSSTTAFHN